VSQDDPFNSFGDDDKTVVVRPSPGGRRRPSPSAPTPQTPSAAPPPQPARPSPAAPPTPAAARSEVGDNPLTAQASSLLSLVARLRRAASHSGIDDLRRELIAEMRNFQNAVIGRGVSQEQQRDASYALCSLLDEAILNTPWGKQSHWGNQSLLVLFHGEAQGGVRFFEILKRLVQQPSQNLYLLELYFLCLSLGFEGKYREVSGGTNSLEQMRSELYALIQRVRGDGERALSPRWQGLKDLRPALIRHVPLWVAAAASAALLILIYLGFLLAINSASDPLFQRIATLPEEKPPLETAVAIMPKPNRTGRFKPLLASEIGTGLVEVADEQTLRIHNSFPSGSDRVKPEFLAMLKKIADELERGGDRVIVSGHTDDQPITRSVRFPSNFDLSEARAKNVAGILLSDAALAGKVRAEGRADSQPLVPNDSPEHRGVNRRVDILIQ
jgi:type VI secretion system protein ImpK